MKKPFLQRNILAQFTCHETGNEYVIVRAPLPALHGCRIWAINKGALPWVDLGVTHANLGCAIQCLAANLERDAANGAYDD